MQAHRAAEEAKKSTMAQLEARRFSLGSQAEGFRFEVPRSWVSRASESKVEGSGLTGVGLEGRNDNQTAEQLRCFEMVVGHTSPNLR